MVHVAGELVVSEWRHLLNGRVELGDEAPIARQVLGKQQLRRRRILHNTSPIIHTHTHTHTRLTALCSGLPGRAGTMPGKTNLDFTEARDSEWQWHQLGHIQVCTSLQADNHASTPPLSFLQAGCPSCRPTDNVKALKAKNDAHKRKSVLFSASQSLCILWPSCIVHSRW